MDSSLLEKFRQQLATWIEQKLETQPLPFQKLELAPRTLTDKGRLQPDLVLWINRDSQLAGSIILLPVNVDDETIEQGVALAKALGLKHFTTWAAREVSIWSLTGSAAEPIKSFLLPPAKYILPHDFQDTLDELLEHLKIVTVTHTLSSDELTPHYFANLCLRNLQELAPGLTMSARAAAGQTEADEWVEKAPREKAWLSLWRILFLLCQGKLPPGLQPDRLEDAIRYALLEMAIPESHLLAHRNEESPLPNEDAVRLYHLAGRLRQLGWPHSAEEATALLDLLLEEAAHRFTVYAPEIPWSSDTAHLRAFCHPTGSTNPRAMIAPRAYLAGWSLKSSLAGLEDCCCVEKLRDLDTRLKWQNAIASYGSSQNVDRKEYETNLVLLRKVWPNRRFDLPRSTPSWIWDTLFLAGLITDDFTLILPENWQGAAGIEELWKLLNERFYISDMAPGSDKRPALRFQQIGEEAEPSRLHRGEKPLEIPAHFMGTQHPGTTQLWLNGDLSVIDKVLQTMACGFGDHWPEERDQLALGVYYYLQTTLGRYIWDLCSNSSPLPETSEVLDAATGYGVPLPDSAVLTELSLALSLPGIDMPETEQIDHEFEQIFGPTPAVEESISATAAAKKRLSRSRFSAEEVTAKVFSDGLPNFPEHYMVEFYQAEAERFQLKGPMEVSGNFFDQFTLHTKDHEYTLEVTGNRLAEALKLASYNDAESVSLPVEEEVLVQITSKYTSDLQRLWESLVRECRRVAPVRKTAAKLAKRIWNEQGLPPLGL